MPSIIEELAIVTVFTLLKEKNQQCFCIRKINHRMIVFFSKYYRTTTRVKGKIILLHNSEKKSEKFYVFVILTIPLNKL